MGTSALSRPIEVLALIHFKSDRSEMGVQLGGIGEGGGAGVYRVSW